MKHKRIIKVKKKNKTVGRHSMVENQVEKFLNWFLSQPKVRKALCDGVLNFGFK